jgi:hypothetical protein
MITLDRLEQKIDALTAGMNSVLASIKSVHEAVLGRYAALNSRLDTLDAVRTDQIANNRNHSKDWADIRTVIDELQDKTRKGAEERFAILSGKLESVQNQLIQVHWKLPPRKLRKKAKK